jgi:hypothetical protein
MFWKGSTAMEGLSGSASGWLDPIETSFGSVEAGKFSSRIRQARIGSAIFFGVCVPHIVEREVDLAADLSVRVVGNANTSGFRDPL